MTTMCLRKNIGARKAHVHSSTGSTCAPMRRSVFVYTAALCARRGGPHSETVNIFRVQCHLSAMPTHKWQRTHEELNLIFKRVSLAAALILSDSEQGTNAESKINCTETRRLRQTAEQYEFSLQHIYLGQKQLASLQL